MDSEAETRSVGASGAGCLVDRVLGDQEQIGRLMMRSASRSWLELDLTMTQLKALVTITDVGPVSVGRLGSVFGIRMPAASLLVDALVRDGLVMRSEDPDDRRRTLVTLSERGTGLMNDLRQGSLGQFANWVSKLGDDDLTALARGLRALVDVMAADAV